MKVLRNLIGERTGLLFNLNEVIESDEKGDSEEYKDNNENNQVYKKKKKRK